MNTGKINNNSKDTQASNAYIVPLLFLASIFFIGFMSRIVFAPLMPAIENDLGIGHGEAGSLFMVISIGYVIALIFSGSLSSRINHRGGIILSSIVAGLGLLFIAFAQNIWQVGICLFLMGAAGGIYLPSGIATLTSLVDPAHWGRALAVHELAPNLSFVVVPILAEVTLRYFSWRGAPVLLGIGAIVVGVTFAFFGKGGDFPGEAPGYGAVKAIAAKPSFWIMSIMFILGIAGTMGIFTMLPLYLITERGMDSEKANTLLGVSRVSGLFMAFVAGWVSDRLGPKKTITGVFFIAGLMTILLGNSPDSWLVPLLFLQPMVAVCFFPAGFSSMSSLGPSSQRNIITAMVTSMASLLGAGGIPLGLGILGEKASFSIGITLVGCLMAGLCWFALRLEFHEA